MSQKNDFSDAEFLAPAILVENLELSVRLFQDVLGFSFPTSGPFTFAKDLDELGEHKLKFAFLEKNGRLIELVEPTTGPRKRMLETRGSGPYLIDFAVKDIDRACDYFKSKGMEILDPVGQPLKDKYHLAATGEKCFYFHLAGCYVEVEEIK